MVTLSGLISIEVAEGLYKAEVAGVEISPAAADLRNTGVSVPNANEEGTTHLHTSVLPITNTIAPTNSALKSKSVRLLHAPEATTHTPFCTPLLVSNISSPTP